MAKKGCDTCGRETAVVRENGERLVICVACDFDAYDCQCDDTADGFVRAEECDDCGAELAACYCTELGIG